MKSLTHGILVIQLLFMQMAYGQAGFTSLGDGPVKRDLIPGLQTQEECANTSYSANPNLTKAKCIQENPISREGDADSRAQEQSQRIINAIQSNRESEFLGNLVSREVESFADDVTCLRDGSSSTTAPFVQLAEEMDGITNCNISTLIEDKCDCVMQALQSGRMKKLSRQERRELNRVVIGSAGKKSFMENLSKHVSQSAVLAYYLNNGSVEQRKKILENKKAHICLPGKMKETLQKDRCDSRIKEEVSASLLRREESCSRGNPSDARCKEWSSFKEVLGVTELDKSNPLMGVIENYEDSNRDNYFSTGFFSRQAQDENPEKLISSINESFENEFVGRHFQFPNTKEEFLTFIEKIKVYEGLKAQAVGNTSGIEGQEEYVQAMNMISHIYQSPFITKKYSNLFNDVDTNTSVSSYFTQLNQALSFNDDYSLEDMVNEIEDESLNNALNECSKISDNFSNTCSMQSALTRIRPEDFVTRGNDIKIALQDAASDTFGSSKENFENGALQYYCSIYAATLENGQVDLVEDDFSIVTNYSYRQKTIDHFRNSLRKMGYGESGGEKKVSSVKTQQLSNKENPKSSNIITDAMINYDTRALATPSNSFVMPSTVVEAKRTIANMESIIDQTSDSDLKESLREDLEKIKNELVANNFSNDRTNSNESSNPQFKEMMEKLEMMNRKVEELSAENERKKKKISELSAGQNISAAGPNRASAQRSFSAKSSANVATGEGNYRTVPSSSSISSGGSSAPAAPAGSSANSRVSARSNGDKPTLSLTMKDIGGEGSAVIVNKRSDVMAALLSANGAPVMLELSKGVFEKYEPVIGEDGKIVIKDGKPLFNKVIVKIDAPKSENAPATSNLSDNAQSNESQRRIYRLDDLNKEIDKSKED